MTRTTWEQLRHRRMVEPGASEAYEVARLAFQLGAKVRELRECRGWTQAQLAEHAEMSQPTVARFESGGATPTLQTLERLALALDADLVVDVRPHAAH